MDKHTPGPWSYDDTGAIFGLEGKPIMTCGEYAIKFGAGTEEAFANARLIAAAPDLLEALRKISITSRYPMTEPENMDYAMECMREIAREAISKAEEGKKS